MTKSEKVRDILNILQKLYPNPEVPLQHKDAYTLLISVLLSAQCTDVRVNQITPHLFKLADNPYDMMKLSIEEIREIIKPCGLSPMKSKGIAGLSKILVERYNGQVPNTIEALEELPAVGHKTASVVMTQWFGIPAFPVDTHIHRLAYRWGLTKGKNVVQTEKDLKRLISEEMWNKAHLQIIYFGREYCPARGHDWKVCPICTKYLRKQLRD
jgi:endonuclease-3